MVVSVRLFAGLRERAGSAHVDVELPDDATVGDLLAAMELAPRSCVVALNREYAAPDARIAPGDEVALVPPVSGGATGAEAAVHSAVLDGPLSLDRVLARVRDPRAGAVVTFQGVTREVERLEYEAYVEMAEERIAAIVEEAVAGHGLCAAAAEHRVGAVPLAEPSVAVAASAPHRGEAFAGAREIIDRIKAEAPIWKKEVEGGEGRWVEGTRP